MGVFLKARAYKELREQSTPSAFCTLWHSGPCCALRQTQVVKHSSDYDVTGPSRLTVPGLRFPGCRSFSGGVEFSP